MRLVYRSISAPLLGELAVTALRIVRDEKLDGVVLGPRSVPRLLEIGLVMDGPKGKVLDLDAKLQKKLRLKTIPYIRREVPVIRKDAPPSVVSSAVPEEEVDAARVVTEGRETHRHVDPPAPAPPAPPTIVNEVRVPEQAPAPVNMDFALRRFGYVLTNALKEALRGQKTPVVNVTIPPIRVPEIKIPSIPAPVVTVNLRPAGKVEKIIKRDGQGRIRAVEEIPEGQG
jgi:hypothetical protein